MFILGGLEAKLWAYLRNWCDAFYDRCGCYSCCGPAEASEAGPKVDAPACSLGVIQACPQASRRGICHARGGLEMQNPLVGFLKLTKSQEVKHGRAVDVAWLGLTLYA